jgi:hypothetical protein
VRHLKVVLSQHRPELETSLLDVLVVVLTLDLDAVLGLSLKDCLLLGRGLVGLADVLRVALGDLLSQASADKSVLNVKAPIAKRLDFPQAGASLAVAFVESWEGHRHILQIAE